MLGQDRHEPEQQRRLAIAVRVEIETDSARLHDRRLERGAVVRAHVGEPLLLELLPGEDHVVGGDRAAIGKARARIEVEDDVAAVGRDFDRAGKQAVKRERFVERASRAGSRRHNRAGRRGDAADDERREAVERPVLAEDDAATLGGVRIDIGEVRKVARQSGCAVHGDAVRRPGGCRGRRRLRPSARTAARDTSGNEGDEQQSHPAPRSGWRLESARAGPLDRLRYAPLCHARKACTPNAAGSSHAPRCPKATVPPGSPVHDSASRRPRHGNAVFEPLVRGQREVDPAAEGADA